MQNQPTTLIRPAEFRRRLGISKSTEHDWRNPSSPRYRPDFPCPVNLGGGRSVAYVESEADNFIRAIIETSRGEA